MLRFADGAPRCRLDDKSPWQTPQQGHKVALGEEISTTVGMSTALSLQRSSSARLFIETGVRVESVSADAVGLRLFQGRLWVDAPKDLTLKIATPVGEVSVSDGAAEIRIDRQKVELTAWRGVVRQAATPEVKILEGHRLVLETGKAPMLKNVPPRPDVWETWNQRLSASLVLVGPLPSLVAAAPAAPDVAAADTETVPTTPLPARPVRRVSAQSKPPALAPAATAKPPSTSSVPAPSATGAPAVKQASASSAGVEEEIHSDPNDPLEKQIADLGTEELMKHVGRLSTDAEANARVDKIGRRIVAVSPRANIAWSFHVLEASQPNAVSVGYGRIYVTKGLLAMIDDEELAGVLGHEIAHACLRHGERVFDEALPYARKAQEARRLALEAQASSDRQRYNEQKRIYQENITRFLEAVERAQSASARWDAEYQADRYGMVYVNNAGYRPNGLVDSLEKLRKAGATDDTISIKGSNSHPPLADRIEIARKVFAAYFPGR